MSIFSYILIFQLINESKKQSTDLYSEAQGSLQSWCSSTICHIFIYQTDRKSGSLTQSESHDWLKTNMSMNQSISNRHNQVQRHAELFKSWLINAPHVFPQQRSLRFSLLWLQILMCHHHCCFRHTLYVLKKLPALLTTKKMLRMMRRRLWQWLTWGMLPLLQVEVEKHELGVSWLFGAKSVSEVMSQAEPDDRQDFL